MSIVIRNTIRGALKLNGLVDRECFTSWQQFLESFPSLMSVEVPENFGGVIAQSAEPSDDDRGKLWLRLDASGNFLAPYVFQGGKWEVLYSFAPGQVIWMTGNSTQVPRGFLLIDTGDQTIPSQVVTQLKNLYLPGSGGGFFAYFAVRFVGF